MRRAPRPATCLLGMLLACQPAAAWAQAQEDELKAAFVYNFALFVQWPAAGGEEIVLCVAHGHAMADALHALDGKQVHHRRLRVVDADPSRARCDVAMYDGEVPVPPAGMETATLTVSDGGDAGDNGAMITLVREDSRMRFDVDRSLAERAGLTLSSKLLALARRVL